MGADANCAGACSLVCAVLIENPILYVACTVSCLAGCGSQDP
jgi:hypothetical protein